MSKRKKIYKIQVSNTTYNFDLTNISLTQLLNYTTAFTVYLFILTVFSSYILKISANAHLNILVYSYIFIVVLISLQLIKLVMGGGAYFPKVNFDVVLLSIPPVIIASYLISRGVTTDTFGTINTWNLSPISILAGVIFAYLLCINFSNKLDLKRLQLTFDFGLVISSLVYLASVYLNSFTPETAGIKYLMIILTPAYVLRLLSSKSISRLEAFVKASVVLLGLGFFLSEMNIFANLNNANYYALYFKPTFIGAAILYPLTALIVIGMWLVKIKFNVFQSISKLNSDIKSKIKGNLFKDLKGLFMFYLKPILAISAMIFSFVILGWMLFYGFLQEFIKTIFEEWTEFKGFDGISQYLFGQEGIVVSNNYIQSFIATYGFFSAIAVAFLIGALIYYYVKNDQSKQFKPFYIAVLLLIFVFSKIYVYTSFAFSITFWFFVALIMIEGREGEIVYDKVKVISLNKIKDQQIKIILQGMRLALAALILIIMLFIVIELLKGAEGQLFNIV